MRTPKARTGRVRTPRSRRRGRTAPLGVGPEDNVDRLADLQERTRVGDSRLTEINEERRALENEAVDEEAAVDALADFDSVWDVMAPREQARVLELLIEHVEHDGQRGNISITFRPTGIETLVAELTDAEENAA